MGRHLGLTGLRFQGATVELCGDFPFQVRKPWHDDKRQGSQRDPDEAVVWRKLLDDRVERLVKHIYGKEQEACADHLAGSLLGRFSRFFITILPQSPQCSQATRDLDCRIETKADEGDASGQESSDKRNDALKRVPGDCQILKFATSMYDIRSIGRYRCSYQEFAVHTVILSHRKFRKLHFRLTNQLALHNVFPKRTLSS